MATEGYKATVTWGSFTGAVIRIDAPEFESAVLDTTHLDMTTTSGWKTFMVSALKDAGELSIEVQFDSAVTLPQLGDASGTLTITYNDGAAPDSNFACSAFVTRVAQPTAENEELLTTTITWKLTGLPTISW